MIKSDTLTIKQRRFIQFGVLIVLAVFIVIYVLFFNKTITVAPTIDKNKSVYIENSVLYAFEDKISLAQYPNRIAMHYPYLLVVKPIDKITYIFNLQKGLKEKDINETILDYSDVGIIKNDGKATFFNDINLGYICEKAYLKNKDEILCLSKIDMDYANNQLLNINPNKLKTKELYKSKELITDFTVYNDKIYIGEIDLYTKKSYVIVDDIKIESPTIINHFYQMANKLYFVSLKSELNGNTESYYLIEDNKLIPQEGRIYLSR